MHSDETHSSGEQADASSAGERADAQIDRGDSPELLVRPYGYVEENPVVRQIGDRDLFIGNESAADPQSHDWSFDFVLSASSDECPLTTHHRPLTDGPGNEWTAFEAAVDTTRRLYRREGSVLVHCKAGISRSSTLLATALAAEENHCFREALTLVQDARPFAMPHPALHELAVVYLAANADGGESGR